MTDVVTLAAERPDQPEVVDLVAALDAYHEGLYPAESNHFLDIAALCAPSVTFVVARLDGRAVGCGAVLADARGWGEIKRMYVAPPARGRGLGARILARLEQAAAERGLGHLRLETGVRNHAALAVYRRAGFCDCAAFGDYAADPLSVFLERRVATT